MARIKFIVLENGQDGECTPFRGKTRKRQCLGKILLVLFSTSIAEADLQFIPWFLIRPIYELSLLFGMEYCRES